MRKYNFKRQYFVNVERDYGRALVYADSEVAVFNDNGKRRAYSEEYGSTLFLKGDVLMAQRKYGEAYEYFYRGKIVMEETNDTCAFFECSQRLGQACYRQALYKEAIPYFEEAFKDLEHCGEENIDSRFTWQQNSLDNMALCYTKSGKLDSAFYFYDSALAYIRKHENRFATSAPHRHFVESALAVIYGNEGDARFRMGDTASAEALYKKSIIVDLEPDHARGDAQFIMAKLAKLYLASHRLPEAWLVLANLKRSLDSLPGKDAEMYYQEQQWHYYDQRGQVDSAYLSLKAFRYIKDSLDPLSKPAQGMDMNRQLQHISGEYELNFLQKEDQLKTVYLFIAIFFSLMAVVIIWMIAQYGKRSRKNIAQLTQLNQTISHQNDHMVNTLGALEQSQQDNARITKLLAHDLRNPIGATAGMVNLLLQDQHASEEQRQMLELIRRAGENALELIQDLTQLNPLQSDMKKEPVDIQSILHYCVDLLRFKAQQKDQQLELQIDPQSDLLSLSVNKEKIWRVISNLITNAIKFSPRGSFILVETAQENGYVIISVRDQGIGIPEDMKDKLFLLTAETKRNGTAGEESFGMGLGISRQIVEAHGGRIWFDSDEHKGSTFYVILPTI